MHNIISFLQELQYIPDFWPLVPVRGKRPYPKGWTELDFSSTFISSELSLGRATGFGLRLGNGYLAIDVDGESAWAFLLKLAGGKNLEILNQSTSWTSDRPGRRQILLAVNPQDFSRIRGRRFSTGLDLVTGEQEYLEFRWIGQQSVLPPSLHPLTGKSYKWINNPIDFPPLPAPDWLLHICQFGLEFDYVRFPARLYSHFRRQMGVWLLARRFDFHYKNNSKFVGSGVGRFTLTAASVILRRSVSRVRQLLRDAKASGLIRNYKQQGDWVDVYYSSLETAIALAGLDTVGPVASIPIDNLSNLNIIATEVEAQSLQRSSFYHQQKESAQGSLVAKPENLLSPSVLLAGVLGRGSRFIYCDRSFRFYGGSQKSISQFRGVSSGTVSRHLSNSYRLAASPLRGFRDDLAPIIKKQLAERLPGVGLFASKFCSREGFINLGVDWFRPRCNVYLLTHHLVSARCRRQMISRKNTGEVLTHKPALCFEKNGQDVLIDKDSLYILDPREINERILVNLKNEKKSLAYPKPPSFYDRTRWKREKNQDKKNQKQS